VVPRRGGPSAGSSLLFMSSRDVRTQQGVLRNPMETRVDPRQSAAHVLFLQSLFLPGQFCVDASLDSDQRARIAAEFRVSTLQKILPDQRKAKAFSPIPCHAKISRAVGRRFELVQGSGVPICRVKFEALWQVE
jgi:hypothetical protein